MGDSILVEKDDNKKGKQECVPETVFNEKFFTHLWTTLSPLFGCSICLTFIIVRANGKFTASNYYKHNTTDG